MIRDRKTPLTDNLQQFMPVGSAWTEHARRLEQDRAAAVEALCELMVVTKHLQPCPGTMEKCASVLAEIGEKG